MHEKVNMNAFLNKRERIVQNLRFEVVDLPEIRKMLLSRVTQGISYTGQNTCIFISSKRLNVPSFWKYICYTFFYSQTHKL